MKNSRYRIYLRHTKSVSQLGRSGRWSVSDKTKPMRQLHQHSKGSSICYSQLNLKAPVQEGQVTCRGGGSVGLFTTTGFICKQMLTRILDLQVSINHLKSSFRQLIMTRVYAVENVKDRTVKEIKNRVLDWGPTR